MEEHLFRYRWTAASDGAAVFAMPGDYVESGWHWRVVKCVVENETSNYTRLRVGVWSGAVFYPHDEIENPQAANIYFTEQDIHLSEGERLLFLLTGTFADDVVRAYVEVMQSREDRP